jgi:hypothetical protein
MTLPNSAKDRGHGDSEKSGNAKILLLRTPIFCLALPPPCSPGCFGAGEGVSNCLYMSYQNPGGERMGSDPIASEKVAIERKIFFLDLKENQRGRFLKITEDVGGRRDTIMLPAPAFKDFLEALQRLVEFEAKL